MEKLDRESTVEEKHTFECICRLHLANVQHHHFYNKLFDTKIFMDTVSTAEQTLSFCGFNVHHENRRAKNSIKDFTTGELISLLHAAHWWPEAIHTALRPAALKNYTNIRKYLPKEFKTVERIRKKKLIDTYNSSLIPKFTRTEIQANLNCYYPFRSPVYVLNKKPRQQKSHNKWSDQSQVGIFICHSPFHASNVKLVLKTQKGNVSPKFHCIYDDKFTICKWDSKFTSLWQHK